MYFKILFFLLALLVSSCRLLKLRPVPATNSPEAPTATNKPVATKEANTPPRKCPSQFVLPFVESNFCVAKYEMKLHRLPDGGGVPESRATDDPWTNLTTEEALLACRKMGDGYALITNEQWQLVAKAIESNEDNWQDGVIPKGRRVFILFGEEVIWDFGGSVREWVNVVPVVDPELLAEITPPLDILELPEEESELFYGFEEFTNPSLKEVFGAGLEHPSAEPYLYGTFNYSEELLSPEEGGGHYPLGTLARGGASGFDEREIGLFAVTLVPLEERNENTGFRCVYNFNTN